MKIHGNRMVYGFRNSAAFNVRAAGDEHWFLTATARNEALASFREYAVRRGLSRSAALDGIVPIRRRAAHLTRDERAQLELDGRA